MTTSTTKYSSTPFEFLQFDQYYYQPPKSSAFPFDGIVIYSIEFNLPGSAPPATNPRVELDVDPEYLLRLLNYQNQVHCLLMRLL